MANYGSPILIGSKSGVCRDTTIFDCDNYVNANWCRWYRGRPKKIGGYSKRNQAISGLGRGIAVDEQNYYSYVHIGSQSKLERFQLHNITGVSSGALDRTPVGFAASPDNVWQFSTMFDGAGNATYLLAHAAPNLSDIASDIDRPIYYGGAFDNAALVPVTGSDVSGGLVALYPYLFALGSDGLVKWSVPGVPTDFAGAGSGTARICGSKVIVGWPMRGGAGVAPAGLLWSIDTLVRVTFVGGTAIFDFDTVSDDITVIAPGTVVEFANVYYWIGIDQFYKYNGVVQSLDNTMNNNFFFETLKPGTAGKIFSYKIPRYNELWWCYVANIEDEFHTQWDEPNHAIIYNERENTWYDTPLPAFGRTAAHYVQAYPFPIMTGAMLDDADKSGLYQHEVGVDANEGAGPLAIPSYFETAPVSLLPPAGTSGKTVVTTVIEPDFLRSGDMTVEIIGRANARAADVTTLPVVIKENPTSPEEQITTLKNANFRQLRYRFESNVLGGDYQMGKVVAHMREGEDTVLGAVEATTLP